MFFDQYILGKNISFAEIPVNIFDKYLINFGKTYIFIDSIADYLPGYINNYDESTYTVGPYNYLNYLLDLIMNKAYDFDDMILLSGFSNEFKAHSVVIYIEKKSDDNYSIHIINTGDGIDRHGPPDSTGNSPIIIRYDNINKDRIIKLCKFTYIMMNLEFRNKFQSAVENEGYTFPDPALEIYYKIYSPYFHSHTDMINPATKEHLFFNAANSHLSQKTDNMDGFYDFINNNIVNYGKGPNSQVFAKCQLSSSCTYFSIYNFIKYFIFGTTNLDNFERFIEYCKKDVITYFIKEFDTNLKKEDKFNSNYFNIAHMFIKDCHNLFTPDELKSLSDKIIKQYKTLDFNNVIILNKKQNINDYLTEIIRMYGQLKYSCFNDKSGKGENILTNFNDLVTYILKNYKLIKNPNIYKIFICYILIRSTKIINLYYENLTVQFRDIHSIIPTINNIMENIREIDKKIFDVNPISMFHCAFINLQIVNSVLSKLVDDSYPLRMPGIANLNTKDEYIDYVEKYMFIRQYYNYDIDINSLQTKIFNNLGVFFNGIKEEPYSLNNNNNNSCISIKLISAPTYFLSHINLSTNDVTNLKKNNITNLNTNIMSDYNYLLFNIIQINNNNYKEIINKQTIMGVQDINNYNKEFLRNNTDGAFYKDFTKKYSQLYNRYYANDIHFVHPLKKNNNDLYKFTITNVAYDPNKDGDFEIFVNDNIPNNNFQNQKILINNLNLDNFFKYIDNLIPYLVDQYIYLLYIYKYNEKFDTIDSTGSKVSTEVKVKINDFFNNNPNSKNYISYYLFRDETDFKMYDVLKTFLLYLIYDDFNILKYLPNNVKDIYNNYYILHDSQKIHIFLQDTSSFIDNQNKKISQINSEINLATTPQAKDQATNKKKKAEEELNVLIDNINTKKLIANDLINMIVVSIMYIKDKKLSNNKGMIEGMEYDDHLFMEFGKIIVSNFEEKINNYDIFDSNTLNLEADINFYDYSIYTHSTTKDNFYYNKYFNYLVKINLKQHTAHNTNYITKLINGKEFFLTNRISRFSDFAKKITNITPINIWKDLTSNDSVIELINFDKIYFECNHDAIKKSNSIKFITQYQEINTYNFNTELYQEEDANKVRQNTQSFNVIENYDSNIIFGFWTKGAMNHFILNKGSDYYLLILNSNEYVNNYRTFNKDKPELWNESIRADAANNSFLEKNDKKYYILKFNYNYITFDIERKFYLPLMNSLMLARNNLAIYLILNIFSNNLHKLKNESYNSYEMLLFNYLYSYLDIPYVVLFNYKIIEYDNSEKIEYNDKIDKRLTYFSYEKPNSGKIKDITITEKNQYRLEEIECLSTCIRDLQIQTTTTKANIYAYEVQNFVEFFRGNCEEKQLCTNIEEFKELYKDNDEFNLDKILIDLINTKTNLPLLCNIYINNLDDLYNKLIKVHFNSIYKKLVDNHDKGKLNCNTYLKDIIFLDTEVIYNFYKTNKNTNIRTINPRTIEDILFELHCGFFIRDDQKKMLYDNTKSAKIEDNKIIDDLQNNNNSKIYEILMGRGKTSTITPLILLNQYYTNSKKDNSTYYIVLPKHLVDQSFDIIVKFSELFYNFNILAYFKKNFGIANSDLLNKPKFINIINDQIIKEYVLESIKKEGESNPTKELSLNYFNKENLFIYDEIDSLIDPFKSDLNIPVGPINHINHNLIVDNLILIVKNYYNSKEMDDDEKIKMENNNYGINDIKIPTFELEKKLKDKLCSTINQIKDMTYNQNFGFGNIAFRSYDDLANDSNGTYKCFFIAVPYAAINAPINESEFTDFELAISLTILSYFEEGLRKEDVFIYLNNIIKFINSPDVIQARFKNILKIINIDFLEIYSKKNNFDRLKDCEYLLDDISDDNEIINEYLLFIIERYFKISKQQHNISMIDIFSHNFSTKKIGFSGSVNFCLPKDIIDTFLVEYKPYVKDIQDNLFNNIIYDNITRASIFASLWGVTRKGDELNMIKSYTADLEDKEVNEQKLFDFLKQNLKIYNSLIDTAGLIIERTIDQVVSELNTYFIENTDSRGNKDPIIRSILYVNNNDVRMIYTESNKIVDRPYNNEIFDNCFIFYDNKHTVGIDFKQPSELIGLITISPSNTLTEVSQGIFRLRNINLGHNVDFYIDDRIVTNGVKGVKDTDQIKTIIKLLQTNDLNKQISSTFNMQLQCLKFLNRNIQKTSNSYLEDLYYDLVPDNNGKYIDKKDFIDNEIQRIINDINAYEVAKIINVSDKLTINKFEYVDSNVRNTNLSIQLNINLNLELVTEKNINFPLKAKPDATILQIHTCNQTVNVKNIDQGMGGCYNKTGDGFNIIFKGLNMSNIRISGWDITYSYLFVLFLKNSFKEDSNLDEFTKYLKNRMEFENISNINLNEDIDKQIISKKYCFLYKRGTDKLTIITFFDYLFLLKDFDSSPKPIGGDKLNYYDCIIYDCFNNIIFDGNNYTGNKLPPPIIPDEILLLFFHSNIDIYSSYRAAKRIINAGIPNLNIIMEFITTILHLETKIKLYKDKEKPTDPDVLYNLDNCADYSIWHEVLYFPKLFGSDLEKQNIINIIAKNYDDFENGKTVIQPRKTWDQILQSFKSQKLSTAQVITDRLTRKGRKFKKAINKEIKLKLANIDSIFEKYKSNFNNYNDTILKIYNIMKTAYSIPTTIENNKLEIISFNNRFESMVKKDIQEYIDLYDSIVIAIETNNTKITDDNISLDQYKRIKSDITTYLKDIIIIKDHLSEIEYINSDKTKQCALNPTVLDKYNFYKQHNILKIDEFQIEYFKNDIPDNLIDDKKRDLNKENIDKDKELNKIRSEYIGKRDKLNENIDKDIVNRGIDRDNPHDPFIFQDVLRDYFRNNLPESEYKKISDKINSIYLNSLDSEDIQELLLTIDTIFKKFNDIKEMIEIIKISLQINNNLFTKGHQIKQNYLDILTQFIPLDAKLKSDNTPFIDNIKLLISYYDYLQDINKFISLYDLLLTNNPGLVSENKNTTRKKLKDEITLLIKDHIRNLAVYSNTLNNSKPGTNIRIINSRIILKGDIKRILDILDTF